MAAPSLASRRRGVDRAGFARRLAALAAVAIAALSIGVGCATGARAFGPVAAFETDWAAVVNLHPGSRLRIEASGQGVITGRFLRADVDQLLVRENETDRTIARPDVNRIFLVERQTGKKAKRGFLVGLVAGSVMGTFGTKSNRLPWALMLGGGWGTVGAGIGASDGFFDWKETLIFEATPTTTSEGLTRLANQWLKPTASGASAP